MAKKKKFDSFSPDMGIQNESDMTNTPEAAGFSFSGLNLAQTLSENLTEIDIDEIVPLKGNPMNMDEDENFQALMDSIKEVGFLKEQPLVGERLSDGKIELISGNRRYLASLKLGIKKVPIIIKEFKNDAEKRRFIDLYNTYRDPKLKDILNRYQHNAKLYDEGYWDGTQIGKLPKLDCVSRIIGYPRSKIHNILFLQELMKSHEKILDLIDDDIVVVNDMRKLVSLNKEDKLKNFNDILDQLCKDGTINNKDEEKKKRKAAAKKIIGQAQIKWNSGTLEDKNKKKAQVEIKSISKKIDKIFKEDLMMPKTEKQKAETIEAIDNIMEKIGKLKSEIETL